MSQQHIALVFVKRITLILLTLTFLGCGTQNIKADNEQSGPYIIKANNERSSSYIIKELKSLNDLCGKMTGEKILSSLQPTYVAALNLQPPEMVTITVKYTD